MRSDKSPTILLEQIEKALPKKLRKKLRWKKVAPILGLVLGLLLRLADSLTDQQQSKSPSRPAKRTEPSAQPPPRNAPQKTFHDDALQANVERAEAYRAEIDRLVQHSDSPLERDRLQELANHVHDWTNSIKVLAQRVDNIQRNKLISQDLETVPKSISKLEARLAKETDPMMIAELERTVVHRRNQLAALEKLQKTKEWAEIKIESTLSLLGTIYSQILTGQSKDHVADYRRLLDDIDEEVHSLQDYLEALEEVKLSRL